MSSQLQINYILPLVKDSNSKCGKWKMSLGRNQGVSLENGGFSHHFCKSVVCMRETMVCIVKSSNRLLLLNMAGMDCGGTNWMAFYGYSTLN